MARRSLPMRDLDEIAIKCALDGEREGLVSINDTSEIDLFIFLFPIPVIILISS
jgi:hypothetical protein